MPESVNIEKFNEIVIWSIPIVKTGNLIIAAGIFCFYGATGAGAPSRQAVDLSEIKWVTPNPPDHEELAASIHVVEFWATWCFACKIQLPRIQTLAKKYEDQNVIFIGLAQDQSADDIRRFIEKKNINYHIGIDNGPGDSLNVKSIPTVFVISHLGEILWSGYPGDRRFEKTIKSAINAAPKPMLAGVELGRFSHLRMKLCGGKYFAQAYSELEAGAKSCCCSEKNCACRVFRIVNEKLREKIAAAQDMRGDDLQTALAMYEEIVDNYSGIALTREIETIYYQLQQQMESPGHKTYAIAE